MKTWLTADELAELELPGLPATKRNINAWAEREGWSTHKRLSRPRAGRGGGIEYHIELLPLEARMAYAGRFAAGTAEASLAAMNAAPDTAGTVSAAAQTARDARIALLGAFDAFERAGDVGRKTAAALFARLYNRGEVDVPPFVRETVHSLSVRTILRWLASRRGGDLGRLAVDRGAGRRGQGILDVAEDGRIKVKAMALIVRQPHLSADHVREYLIDLFGETVEYRGGQVPMPGVRALQKALRGWRTDHELEFTALTNPDLFKSRYRASGSRSHLVTALNAVWEIDASPADVLTKEGRYTIYVCVDVFSRRLIISVSQTPRAAAVALLIRKALVAWGVPQRIKTDNGSDFVARATVRLMAALGIETETAHAFSPEEKGAVERAIGTVQRDLMPTLPGFIGHDVADRKVIEARRAFAQRLGEADDRVFCVDLSPDELQRYCDEWAEGRYAHRQHGGLGGATPFQVAAAWRHPVRRIEDEAALALLCAPIAGSDGMRTVGKQGIRIEHVHYLCPELLVGERVFVRLDPADMGRVYVFGEDGETFRGIAVAPDLTGIDRAELVAQTRAHQRRYVEERTAEIRREAKRIGPRDVVDAINRRAATQAGKLVEFPKKAEPHTTPALEAASIALTRTSTPEAAPLSAENTALLRSIEAELAQGSTPAAVPSNVAPIRTAETPQQRFRRALDLEARIAAGGAISTEEALWLGGYRETAEHRSLASFYADFGDAALL